MVVVVVVVIDVVARKSAAFSFDPSHRVILLKGAESYLQSQYLRMIADGLEQAHGEPATRFEFEGQGTTLATLLDELRSYGLMQSHKLVVLDNAEQFVKKESHRRGLESYVESPMEEATLVLRTTGDWRAPRLEKGIAACGAVVPCEAPDPGTAAAWCVGRAEKAHGATLPRDAAMRLVDRVGPSLARLDAELGKLAVAADGEPPRIDVALVEAMVPPSREEQGWIIQSVVLSGDRGRTVRVMRELLDVSRVPEQVLSWALLDLGRKLHEAARQIEAGIGEAAVGKSLRLWGPDTGPVLQTARRLGGRRAARIFDLALETDIALKTGRARDDARTLEGLAVMLAEACGRPARQV
jgi:DNA polymerase III delta subunit